MHRYLAQIGHAPGHPLTIQMPVSLRHEGDGAAGNVLGVGLVELGRLAAAIPEEFATLQQALGLL